MRRTRPGLVPRAAPRGYADHLGTDAPRKPRRTPTPTPHTHSPVSGALLLLLASICSCKILRNSYTKIRYKAGRNRGFHNKTKVHFLADVNIRKIRNIRCTLTVLCQTCPLDSRKLCLLWPWPRGRTRIYGFQIHLVKRVLLASVSNEAH